MSHTMQAAKVTFAPGKTFNIKLDAQQELTIDKFTDELAQLDVVDAATLADVKKKTAFVNGRPQKTDAPIRGLSAGTMLAIQFEERPSNG